MALVAPGATGGHRSVDGFEQASGGSVDHIGTDTASGRPAADAAVPGVELAQEAADGAFLGPVQLGRYARMWLRRRARRTLRLRHG